MSKTNSVVELVSSQILCVLVWEAQYIFAWFLCFQLL